MSFPLIRSRTLIQFVHDFFLSGLWGPTWFLMALVIGVMVVKLIKSLNVIALVVFLGCVYLFCYTSSTGKLFLSDTNNIRVCVEWYEHAVSKPYWSFPLGIVWCGMGYLLVRYEDVLRKHLKLVKVISTLSALALFIEWIATYLFTHNRCCNSYLALLPLCPMLFVVIKNLHCKVDCALWLRKSSVVIFITHIQVIVLLRPLLDVYDRYNILKCVLPIIIGTALAWCMMQLQKTRGFEWIKYAY